MPSKGIVTSSSSFLAVGQVTTLTYATYCVNLCLDIGK